MLGELSVKPGKAHLIKGASEPLRWSELVKHAVYSYEVHPSCRLFRWCYVSHASLAFPKHDIMSILVSASLLDSAIDGASSVWLVDSVKCGISLSGVDPTSPDCNCSASERKVPRHNHHSLETRGCLEQAQTQLPKTMYSGHTNCLTTKDIPLQTSTESHAHHFHHPSEKAPSMKRCLNNCFGKFRNIFGLTIILRG